MTLIDLLAERHAKDVFVRECKDGPTWYGSHMRLDAWAMKRSWANPLCTGYEIKHSRSDFLHDDKWHAYLPYCNAFFFVAPDKTIINPAELPEGVGLIVPSTNFTRLYTIRKAAHREMDEAVVGSLYKYILMSRAEIKGYEFDERQEAEARIAEWRRWLERKGDWRELGKRIRGRAAGILAEAEAAVHLAEKKVAGYEAIRARLVEMGHDPDIPLSDWGIDRQIDRLLNAGIPDGLGEYNLRRLSKDLDALADTLAKIKQ